MVVPSGRLWSEEVSEMSGEAEAALAVSHLMLDRKLYYRASMQSKLTGVWEKGVKVFIRHCLVWSSSVLYTKKVVLVLMDFSLL